MYQAKIGELHPKSRADGENIDLKTNLDSFYEEPKELTDAEYDARNARGKHYFAALILREDHADALVVTS